MDAPFASQRQPSGYALSAWIWRGHWIALLTLLRRFFHAARVDGQFKVRRDVAVIPFNTVFG